MGKVSERREGKERDGLCWWGSKGMCCCFDVGNLEGPAQPAEGVNKHENQFDRWLFEFLFAQFKFYFYLFMPMKNAQKRAYKIVGIYVRGIYKAKYIYSCAASLAEAIETCLSV